MSIFEFDAQVYPSFFVGSLFVTEKYIIAHICIYLTKNMITKMHSK
jgi:hypothetical protein